MNLRSLVTVFLSLGILSGCLETTNSNVGDLNIYGNGDGGAVAASGSPEFIAARETLIASCSNCHASSPFIADWTDEQDFVSNGYIDPGFSASSFLYNCITVGVGGGQGCNTAMKDQSGAGGIDISAIEDWIRSVN